MSSVDYNMLISTLESTVVTRSEERRVGKEC